MWVRCAILGIYTILLECRVRSGWNILKTKWRMFSMKPHIKIHSSNKKIKILLDYTSLSTNFSTYVLGIPKNVCYK
jgi:hypothetical protein